MSLFYDSDAMEKSEIVWPEKLHGLVGADLESKDEGLNADLGPGWPWGGGYVIGASLAWEGGGCYYPVAHGSGNNIPEKKVIEFWLHHMKDRDITWCFANAAYDIGWTRRWADHYGLTFRRPAGRILDIQTMAPLLDEYRKSFSLNALGKAVLGRGKDEEALRKVAKLFGVNPKSEMWKLPPEAVAKYALQDSTLTREIAIAQLPMIADEGLEEASQLEHDLIHVLVDMRWQGIRVDVDKAERVKIEYVKREKAAIAEIKRISGVRVDQWSADSVAVALRTEGITPPKTLSGGASVTKELISKWEKEGSLIARLVGDARKWQKAYSTFLDGQILGFARKCGDEYRIFPEFHPLRMEREDGSGFGTVSYRFSCTNPGMQLLPGRDGELTADIRGCILADKGELWHAPDYSQQEPRMGIHYAVLGKQRGGTEALRAVKEDPKWDFHDFTAKIVGLPRKSVKEISLGRMYGAGGGSIAEKLGLPTEMKKSKSGFTYKAAGPEGQAMLDEYDAGMPWVKKTADFCEQRAKDRGFIRLLGGYKARFVEDGPKGSNPRQAFNRVCQASGAIQNKRAMVDAHAAGVKLRISMHDENGASGDEKAGKMLVECMQNAYSSKLVIPFRVDHGVGDSWGSAV